MSGKFEARVTVGGLVRLGVAEWVGSYLHFDPSEGGQTEILTTERARIENLGSIDEEDEEDELAHLRAEVERLKGQGDKFEAMVFDLQDQRLTLERELVRCRTEKQELIRRLEGLMDDWYDRSNEARREAGPGPCTEASTLEDCAEELGAALDEVEGKITPGA